MKLKTLTPIQLSIDSLREKYKNNLTKDKDFEKYLETINRNQRYRKTC